MDPLSDMLGGIRAEAASVSRASLAPPWTIRFTDGAPLTMLTVIAGGGSVVLADGTELKVGAGDTALIRGPEPFHLADTAASPDRPHKTYEMACFDPDARCDLVLTGDVWGNHPEGSTTMIVGAYRAPRTRHERLLRTLPAALVLQEDIGSVLWLSSMRDALSSRSRPGGQALVDRILDWGLVCTLGCWFDQEGAAAPAWYRGAMDPVAGPALEAIHQRPHQPWTVDSLAAEAKVSRAHFAKRFTEVMGQPPRGYLTEWRMYRAEELLSDPSLSVATVAATVGYTDPFTFSTAFKRLRGMSPRTFRSQAALADAGTSTPNR